MPTHNVSNFKNIIMPNFFYRNMVKTSPFDGSLHTNSDDDQCEWPEPRILQDLVPVSSADGYEILPQVMTNNYSTFMVSHDNSEIETPEFALYRIFDEAHDEPSNSFMTNAGRPNFKVSEKAKWDICGAVVFALLLFVKAVLGDIKQNMEIRSNAAYVYIF